MGTFFVSSLRNLCLQKIIKMSWFFFLIFHGLIFAFRLQAIWNLFCVWHMKIKLFFPYEYAIHSPLLIKNPCFFPPLYFQNIFFFHHENQSGINLHLFKKNLTTITTLNLNLEKYKLTDIGHQRPQLKTFPLKNS